MWSYESQVLLVCTFPAALLASRGLSRRNVLTVIPWYLVFSCYCYLSWEKYHLSAASTYQATVIRKTWTLASLVSDWLFNIGASLRFWTWLPPLKAVPEIGLAIAVVLIFVALPDTWYRAVSPGDPEEESAGDHRPLVAGLVAGFTAVVLSFPVYLLLDTSRSLWRTQLLSGPGAGLFLAALAGLVSLAVRPRWRRTVLIAAAAPILFCGSVGALQSSKHHWIYWERYRSTVAAILRAVPNIRPGTVLILKGVDRNNDPFQDNLWFDMAMRLAYPGTTVSGMYLFSDGAAPPGANLKAAGDRWRWDGTGLAPLVRDAPIANTVVVEYDGESRAHVVPTLLPADCRDACITGDYSPKAVIAGSMSPIAARRFDVRP